MRTNLLLALANWYKRHKKAHYESQAEYHRVKAATYERCIPDNGEKVTGSLIVAIAHHTANEAKYRSLAKTLVALALLFPVVAVPAQGVWAESYLTSVAISGTEVYGNPIKDIQISGPWECRQEKPNFTRCIPTAKPTWRKN